MALFCNPYLINLCIILTSLSIFFKLFSHNCIRYTSPGAIFKTIKPTLFSAALTAAICINISGQYFLSSIILCNPLTCPSIFRKRRSRFPLFSKYEQLCHVSSHRLNTVQGMIIILYHKDVVKLCKA